MQEVEDDSPAEDAGLRAGDDEITFQGQPDIVTGGDLIVAVDGEPLTRSHDLTDVISTLRRGRHGHAHGRARRQAPRGEGRARAPARRLRQLNAPCPILAMLRAWRRCPTWLTVAMSR